jgi:hypothetical protein
LIQKTLLVKHCLLQLFHRYIVTCIQHKEGYWLFCVGQELILFRPVGLLSSFGGEREPPERGLSCCYNNLMGNILVMEYVQTWPEEMHCPILYFSMLLAFTWED